MTVFDWSLIGLRSVSENNNIFVILVIASRNHVFHVNLRTFQVSQSHKNYWLNSVEKFCQVPGNYWLYSVEKYYQMPGKYLLYTVEKYYQMFGNYWQYTVEKYCQMSGNYWQYTVENYY